MPEDDNLATEGRPRRTAPARPEQRTVTEQAAVTPPAEAAPTEESAPAAEPEVPFEEGQVGEQGEWHEDAIAATADEPEQPNNEETA